jgi:DNA replication and repair protein RecF
MQVLNSLKLKDFRNFSDAEFDFGMPRILITGANGLGKSNLFEAIYFLAVAKSNRNVNDAEVVRYGQSEFDIRASITRVNYSFSSRVYYHPQVGKRAYIDRKPLPRLSDLIGTFNAVLFSPEEVDLVMRSPSKRRRILDILVSQSNPAYLSDLQAYRRVLAQRNHLLKSSRGKLNARLVETWDAQLVDFGSRIVMWRAGVVKRMVPKVTYFYHYLFPNEEGDLSVSYMTTSADTEDVRSISASLLEGLTQRRRQEATVGHTLYGPHLDTLMFSIKGHDVQQSASQGQLKSILTAWKFSEALFLEEVTGLKPVILFDDVFSELDESRARSLLNILDTLGQVFLTSARDRDLPMIEHGFYEIPIAGYI